MDISEQSILAEAAKNDPKADIRRKAVKKLKDQIALGEVAKNDLKTDIRIMALKRLTEQSIIGEVAKNDLKTDIRMMALKKLKDQAAIGEIAKNDQKTDIRRIALKKLTDPEVIFEIAKTDPNADIRLMALKKLKKLTGKAVNITKIENIKNPDNLDNSDISEKIDIFEKINSSIQEIDLLKKSINDAVVSNEIYTIKSILIKMTTFLKEEKDIERRVEQLDQFISYYFPTLIKILGSYRQITEHNLDGENALETRKRIIESMPVIRKAFEKELDNMYENKMLDITTDIDVLETMLAKDGILDNKSFV